MITPLCLPLEGNRDAENRKEFFGMRLACARLSARCRGSRGQSWTQSLPSGFGTAIEAGRKLQGHHFQRVQCKWCPWGCAKPSPGSEADGQKLWLDHSMELRRDSGHNHTGVTAQRKGPVEERTGSTSPMPRRMRVEDRLCVSSVPSTRPSPRCAQELKA